MNQYTEEAPPVGASIKRQKHGSLIFCRPFCNTLVYSSFGYALETSLLDLFAASKCG